MSASIAVDVSRQALREGILSPLVVMRSVWERFVEAPDDTEEQDRLVAVLQSAYLAVQLAMFSHDRPDRLRFAVRFGPLADQGEPIMLELLLSEPILVVDLPLLPDDA